MPRVSPTPALVLARLTAASPGLHQHLEDLLDLLGGGGLGLGPALVVPGVRLHHVADKQLRFAPGPALFKTESRRE